PARCRMRPLVRYGGYRRLGALWHPFRLSAPGDCRHRRLGCAAVVEPSDDPRGRADSHAMRGYVARHHRAGADDRAAADPDAVEHDRARADPGAVLDHDAPPADALVHDRTGHVAEVGVDRQNLPPGPEQHRLADGHPALAAYDDRLSDERPPSDLDERVGQVAEVEDVQLGVVHDEGVVADVDAAG